MPRTGQLGTCHGRLDAAMIRTDRLGQVSPGEKAHTEAAERLGVDGGSGGEGGRLGRRGWGRGMDTKRLGEASSVQRETLCAEPTTQNSRDMTANCDAKLVSRGTHRSTRNKKALEHSINITTSIANVAREHQLENA